MGIGSQQFWVKRDPWSYPQHHLPPTTCYRGEHGEVGECCSADAEIRRKGLRVRLGQEISQVVIASRFREQVNYISISIVNYNRLIRQRGDRIIPITISYWLSSK